MQTGKTLLLMLVGIGAVVSATAAAQSPGPPGTSARHIKSVTAITEVFGDGQKIVAAAVEYDAAIDLAHLLPSTFAVAERTITKVYTNTSPARTARPVNGRYAIIELSAADEAASIIPAIGGGRGGPGGPGGPGGQAQGPGGPRGGMGGPKRRPVKVSVTQAGDVVTAAGQRYAAVAAPIENDKAINLTVDDFKPFVFNDAESGKTLMYNLFVPRNYDPKKSYPLVLFMHDASVVSSEPDRTLVQGLGAVIWASPEEQAKHPAFVLAPQEDPQTGSDPTKTADLYARLVNSVVGQYSVDRKRLYTTGQSAGCMRSIGMDIKYPDLFAASLLVAGQGDAQEMLAMIHQRLWIIVSEGDFRAFPGMNASVEAWEKAGARITKGRWSARDPQEVQAANVAKMIAERNTIMYTTYVKGTCLPPEQANSGGQEHMASWQFAYAIPSVRDWLFAQSK